MVSHMQPQAAPRPVEGRASGLVGRLTLGVAALSWVLGCGAEEPTEKLDGRHPSLELAVDAPGPFRAGHRSLEHRYLPDGETDERVITLDVWYPTEDTSGEVPIYLGIFNDPHAFEGASLAAPLGSTYPVHVHSHGHQGWGGTSSELMAYFASHGWVAVAPNHTGNTLTDNWNPRPTTTFVVRPQDISQALDHLAQLPKEDPLSGRLALERVVMSGHSFGSYTTWAIGGAGYDIAGIRAACPSEEGTCSEAQVAALAAGLRDPRVVAGIPMAGNASSAWLSDLDATETPMLMMTASDDPVGADTLFASVSSLPLMWVEVSGGCHQLFALGGCRDIESAVGYAIVDTYALAFARHHVLDDTSATTLELLSGERSVSSLVTLRRRP